MVRLNHYNGDIIGTFEKKKVKIVKPKKKSKKAKYA